MRISILSSLAAAALAFTILPAEAAWHGYINREAGFSFLAPGDLKTEKGSYQSALGGQRPATIYRSSEDNIDYKVTVAEFTGRGSDEAAILKEASAQILGNRKVLHDDESRVDSTYGRKMTVDLPNNGGRVMGGVFFKQNRLILLEVIVLPANGDYGTPDMGRFVDSVSFVDSRIDAGATELKLVK